MGADRPLSPALIARTAARIADGEGLEAVSMRRVAGDLEVSAMALYRHVAGRQDLLLLMADAVKSHSLLPEGEHRWQDMLSHMAESLWRTFTAHPWLLGIILSPSRLVNLAAPEDVERLLSALSAAGLTEDEGFECVLGVSAAVIGIVSVAGAASSPTAVSEPAGSGPAGPGQEPDTGQPGSSAGYPRAERFQQRTINREVSRQSLDFLVARFISGIEAGRTQAPGPVPDPALRKE
ncbi:MAG: TetR/AcrR family transcriptional regulator C-terminal domain-containing protein [Arthrobacter sp.]